MKQKTYVDGLVSVIMPCYNVNFHIKEAIQSVLEQSYSNLELLIVDDASTNPMKNMISEFFNDKRVRFIQHSENQGVAIARNTGLEKSKGRYVAFLDSDDLWHVDKLEKQLSFMNTYQLPFVYSGYEVIRKTSDNVINEIKVPEQLNYLNLLKNTIIGCLTVLIDREKTGYFKMPIISVGEDTATWLNILKKGYIAYGIQEPLAKYRVSEYTLSSNKWKMAKGTWKMYRSTQSLRFLPTCFYFSCYVFNAVVKRI
ncbi:glycosyltransferase family 2 protein [Bacillus mycoides]|uniref:glycosyltransferase family 2 protein n=1 Tax=Bacillus mycoides TaxID=1405 RepID=UPI003D64FE43